MANNFSGDSYVQDIFEEFSEEDGKMTLDSFRQCMRTWGCSRVEISQFTLGEIEFSFSNLFLSSHLPFYPGFHQAILGCCQATESTRGKS